MISLITILLFFIYLWGFGFSLTYFIYRKTAIQGSDFLERHIMNLGIGLGTFAILSVILNFFRIPLDWRIFLLLSLIVPLYAGFRFCRKNGFTLPKKFPKLVVTRSNLFVSVVLFI